MKNIYISDLDGTLLNRSAELSEFTRTNIKQILKANVPFTVASARSVKSIQQMFAGIDLLLPVIEFNGAFITDLKTGKHIKINAIDNEIFIKLQKRYAKENRSYFVSGFNGFDDKLYYDKTANKGQEWYISDRIKNKDPRLEKIDDINQIENEKIVCITIIDTYDNLIEEFNNLMKVPEIEVHLQENPYSPGWHWLTIHSEFATKDKAIKIVKDIANLNDAVLTVFGDNTNDIKMMKAADISIAVENAKEDVKNIADNIIGTNTDDSVIKYILETENIVKCDTHSQ